MQPCSRLSLAVLASAVAVIASALLAGCGGSAATSTSSSTTSTTTSVPRSSTVVKVSTPAATATATTPSASKLLAATCTPQASATVARYLHVNPGAPSAVASIGSQSMPQCAIRVHGAGGGHAVVVTTTLDTAPQAYYRLERTAEEAAQVFTVNRLIPAPVDIPHIGLDADWFPHEQQLMTTDGKRLITVAIAWPHAPQRRQRALAEAVARAYLKRA